MLTAIIGAQFAAAICEANAEIEKVNAMPEDVRAEYIKKRTERWAEEQRQRERAELIEAMKPHTFWSWLGIGSK